MMSKLTMSALLLLIPLLNTACNEAKFTPTNKNRKAEIAQTPEPNCSVVSPTIGQPFVVSLLNMKTTEDQLLKKVWVSGTDGPVEVYSEELGFSTENVEGALLQGNYVPETNGSYKVGIFSKANPEQEITSCIADIGSTTTTPPPPNGPQPVITCSVSQSIVGVGLPVQINVLAPSGFNSPIVQRVQSNTAYDARSTLVFSGSSYVQQGTTSNELVFGEKGDYTITLASGSGEETYGSCEVRVEPIKCEETVRVGANVAFIIDNSSSHEVTDCPLPQQTDEVDQATGKALWQCQAPTEREKAVMQAFELLSNVTASSPEAVNHISLSVFPTRGDYKNGSTILGSGWLEANNANKTEVSSLLDITRNPFGQTPYGAGIRSATNLFNPGPVAGKTPVAIFLTDGEPTDRSPGSTASQAQSLINMGVEVISIKVDSGISEAERWNTHTEILSRFNSATISSIGETWYDASIAATDSSDSPFDAYIAALRGSPGTTPSLLESISSKVDASCTDRVGAICPRRIVSVKDASALKSVVESIIKERVIKCQ